MTGSGGTTGGPSGGGGSSGQVDSKAPHSNRINLENFLAAVYRLYGDFVLKNPFYELDMPIRHNDLFDDHLYRLVQAVAHQK